MRYTYIFYSLVVVILLALMSCKEPSVLAMDEPDDYFDFSFLEALDTLPYGSIDTALVDKTYPLFDGVYIMCGSLDTSLVRTYRGDDSMAFQNYLVWEDLPYFGFPYGKRMYWGAVDSTGRIVIPFIFDGIRRHTSNEALAALYVSAMNLDTGIPRYVYSGRYVRYNKRGRVPEKSFPFHITKIGVIPSDFGEGFKYLGPGYFVP